MNNTRHHICLLSSMHPPKDKRVFDKEARSLQHAGFQVTHLCPGTQEDEGVFDNIKIETYAKPNGIQDRILQTVRLYKLAKKIDADAYHCNEVDSWIVGVLLKLFRRKICVFDVHEHYPSTFAESRFPIWSRSFVQFCIKSLFTTLLPFTDKIVLAKESVSQDFKTSDKKKVLVRNFTPVSSLKISPEFKRSTKNNGDTITLLHLGLFSKLRGWPQGLEALTKINDKRVKLKVIGDINDGSRDEFDAYCKENDLTDQVSVLGWLPFEEAFEHLLKADVGLILFQPGTLNHVYAMPHKMFDYMAAEMAVILPDFAVEVAPIVRAAKCGFLVDPSNPDDIANKIRRILEDPSLITKFGKNGRKAVEQTYNWEAEAEQLIAMYVDLFR